jgi:hypothetical protein
VVSGGHQRERPVPRPAWYPGVSLREFAQIAAVHESTVKRWNGQGLLAAYFDESHEPTPAWRFDPHQQVPQRWANGRGMAGEHPAGSPYTNHSLRMEVERLKLELRLVREERDRLWRILETGRTADGHSSAQGMPAEVRAAG